MVQDRRNLERMYEQRERDRQRSEMRRRRRERDRKPSTERDKPAPGRSASSERTGTGWRWTRCARVNAVPLRTRGIEPVRHPRLADPRPAARRGRRGRVVVVQAAALGLRPPAAAGRLGRRRDPRGGRARRRLRVGALLLMNEWARAKFRFPIYVVRAFLPYPQAVLCWRAAARKSPQPS